MRMPMAVTRTTRRPRRRVAATWLCGLFTALCIGWSTVAAAQAGALLGLPGSVSRAQAQTQGPEVPPVDWAARLADAQSEYDTLQTQPQAPEREERERLLIRLIAQTRQYLEQQSRQVGEQGAPATPTAPPVLEGEPPYSVFQVDQLRDRRDQLLARQEALESSLKHMEQQLSSALLALRKADEALRLKAELHERAISAQSPTAVSTLGALEVAKLQQQLAQLQVAMADEARPPLQAQVRVTQSQLGPLSAAIDLARVQQRLDEDDLQELKRANRERLEAVEAEQQDVALRLAKVLRGPDSTWRQKAAAAMQGEILSLGQLMSLVRGDDEIWSYRARLLSVPTDARTQRDARTAMSGAILQLEAKRAAAEERLRLLKLQQRDFPAGQETQDTTSSPRRESADADRASALRALANETATQQRLIAHLERTMLLLQRSLGDANSQSGGNDGARTGQDLKVMLLSWLEKLWRFELFSATDTTTVNGRSVTVEYGITIGKSVGALILFVLGYLIAGRLTRAFVAQLANRLGLSAPLARVIQRWMLSLLVVLVLLLVLRMAKVPLTAFAFLGGALAIGIGFGAQNVIKNLISGVIILFERKVRVGDTVTVGTTSGEVVAVDLRASTIRGFDGIEAIIPNSTLLEQQVSNWTSGQPLLRRVVRLTVARGADMASVRGAMLDCAGAHSSVLAQPAPDVLMEDLQADVCELALYFWVRLDGSRTGPQVDSDLRCSIDERLRDLDLPLGLKRTVLEFNKDIQSAVPLEGIR